MLLSAWPDGCLFTVIDNYRMIVSSARPLSAQLLAELDFAMLRRLLQTTTWIAMPLLRNIGTALHKCSKIIQYRQSS